MDERWRRAQDLFLEAVDLDEKARAAFLDSACAGDLEMKREVESLLLHDRGGEQAITDALEGTAQSLLESFTIRAGTMLGDYQVQELIGAGGMGEVYRAHDTKLARSVAVKVLPHLLRYDPERLQRFQREARAAAALNHPNIIAVYRLGFYEGIPFLASELLEGANLRETMRRGPLPIRTAVEYGAQIARGLAAAHEKGIVHRDLKPENLFVMRDGQVKILDFGLAKLTRSGPSDPAADSDPIMGTIGYMSPEQVRGEAADHRTDIFSFGLILFEMLSGQRAFQRPTAPETLSAIVSEDPQGIAEFLPFPAPALQRVVHRCLEKNPELRFQSASDLAFALEALSDTERFNRGVEIGNTRSRRMSIVGLAVILVLAAAGVGYWWMRPAGQARVDNVRQLTDDGETKAITLEAAYGSLASDGARVYCNEKRAGEWKIVELSARGGDSTIIKTPVYGPIIASFDPLSSNLLTLNGWLLPLPAGNARRAGDLSTLNLTSSEFFPDGRHIAYASGTAIYIADNNGANPRKILETGAEIRWLSVSPDGKRIRFTLLENTSETIQEISSEGAGRRTVINPRGDADYTCCGKWTHDGRFYVFLSGSHGSSNIWALPDVHSRFSSASATPTQLTYGPLSYYVPLPSADNRTIFAIGAKQKGELSRYDSSRKEFVPFLGGISATDAMPSADGHWVVFLSYPDSLVWRSRPDGSEKMQLSTTRAFFPRISPDANKVVFVAWDPNKGLGAYVVGIEGGTAERVMDGAIFASWSPDGNQLVAQIGLPHPLKDSAVSTIDLGSRELREIPGSRGKLVPFWLNPKTLLAGGETGLEIYDFASQKWSSLAAGKISNWVPSLDEKQVYFEQSDDSGVKVLRVSILNHSLERVADLGGVRRVEQYGPGTWIGVTADGSLLITRDVGTQEIYALDVAWP